VNRRPGLPEHLTMEALAAEHAAALQSQFDTPVDLLGTSTRGSTSNLRQTIPPRSGGSP
jgi:hypothetical protein